MRRNDFYKMILWDIVNPLLLARKKRKRRAFDSSCRGLNLGCGIDNPPDWLGIDGGITIFLMRHLPKFFASKIFAKFHIAEAMSFEEYYRKVLSLRWLHYDLGFGIPFADGVVPNIYSSHFSNTFSSLTARFYWPSVFASYSPEA